MKSKPVIPRELVSRDVEQVIEHNRREGAVQAAVERQAERSELVNGTAGQSLVQLESARVADNVNSRGKAAHKLSSSAAYVGANVQSGYFRELEEFCHQSRVDEANAMLDRVRREHERLVSRLRELLVDLA